MAVNYDNFKQSLKNLEIQHEHLLDLSPDFPPFVHEGMRESVIQRFETCYDTLWKTLRRHIVESLGMAEVPNSPSPSSESPMKTICLRREVNGGSSTLRHA